MLELAVATVRNPASLRDLVWALCQDSAWEYVRVVYVAINGSSLLQVLGRLAALRGLSQEALGFPSSLGLGFSV